VNSRLDEIQAAILRVRLATLAARTARRRELARAYRARLRGGLTMVAERDAGHVYHLFPVRTPRRDALREHLRRAGIETLVHYPMALNDQDAFRAFSPAPCPVASTAAAELLSLPLHPGLSDADIDVVVEAVNRFTAGDAAAASD
jgi:dTDP-4-amino-4,6-dideoxygalactose transaminase